MLFVVTTYPFVVVPDLVKTIVGEVKQEKIESKNIVNKWKRNLAFYEELMTVKEPLSNMRMPLINKEARDKKAAEKKEAEAAEKAAAGGKKGKKNKAEAATEAVAAE